MGFWGNLFGRTNKNESDTQVSGIFTLACGEKFPVHRTGTGDGMKVEVNSMGMFVCIYYRNPTMSEISRIKTEDISLFFMDMKAFFECVVQVDDDLLGDAPYCAVLYGKELTDKELNINNIYVCLIDADTNILKSMRIIDVPQKVTSFIAMMQKTQLSCAVSRERYDELVDQVEQNFTCKDMAMMADCALVSLKNYQVKYILKENSRGL